MVKSLVKFNMISTRKERLQNKRLISQLGESDAHFMIRQSNHETQAESRTNMADGGISSNNMNGLIEVNSSQVDMYTLEENIVIKLWNEVDSVITTVETKVQDAVLTAIENLVIPECNWPWYRPMCFQEGVLTVTYWKLTRGIVRVISKAYNWPLQVE